MNRTTPCDFSSTGLSVEAKKYIENTLWNTGSNGEELEEDKIKVGKFYDLERSINTGKICALNNNCNDNVERTTKWTGKIGLIHPSDFGFATSGGNTTSRATCLEKNLYEWDSNMRDCIENNWLLDNTSFQWTITPSAYHNIEAKNSAYVAFRINKDGIVYGSYTYNKFLVYPTTYLKANVKILSGTGEKENPYVVSLSE